MLRPASIAAVCTHSIVGNDYNQAPLSILFYRRNGIRPSLKKEKLKQKDIHRGALDPLSGLL